MNRKSLGADIYSPIRFDGSRNDSMVSNADGSISEFYSGAFNTGYQKDNRQSLEPIEDEDFYVQQNDERMELFKTSAKKNNRANSDLFSRKNTHLLFPDSKSSCSSDKVFGTSPIASVLFPSESVEKSPRVKETKKSEKQNKERLVTKRSSKTKLVPDKFITVRRGSKSGPEIPAPASSDRAQSSKSKENISELLEASATSSVDCSSQTDLTLADLQILMNKVDLKPNVKSGCTVKMSSEPCLVDPIKQPTQIQGNSLEQLKDTIDNEFHDIRQILYFQQLSLSKILYKNLDETESTNSGLKMVAESLNSIIGLLKDDQQLRNTVFSQRFHS